VAIEVEERFTYLTPHRSALLLPQPLAVFRGLSSFGVNILHSLVEFAQAAERRHPALPREFAEAYDPSENNSVLLSFTIREGFAAVCSVSEIMHTIDARATWPRADVSLLLKSSRLMGRESKPEQVKATATAANLAHCRHTARRNSEPSIRIADDTCAIGKSLVVIDPLVIHHATTYLKIGKPHWLF
jgi:hypothetical protein